MRATALSDPAVSGDVPSAVIELRSVEREYPGEPPIRALDDVDLQIAAGEMVAIVGPSGSGKSTLLNVMGTLDRPTAGDLFIDGINTRKLSERRLCGLRAHRLGFVFQGFHLVESATIIDNVADGLVYQGVGRHERISRARQALELVGLAHRASTRPPKLSGGQRQRVAIARAIVSNPSLLLADEPTGNLDTATSASILELLHNLNHDQGVTIAIITHDPEVADQTPRRITMRDGRIVADEHQNHQPLPSTEAAS